MSLTTIESSGTTNLLTDGTYYYLQIGDGPLVELSYNGAPVTVGEYGGWTPIAAQETSTGYEVAWKLTGSDQYGVWGVCGGCGTQTATATTSHLRLATYRERAPCWNRFEPSFNYDLDGDGTIGFSAPARP